MGIEKLPIYRLAQCGAGRRSGKTPGNSFSYNGNWQPFNHYWAESHGGRDGTRKPANNSADNRTEFLAAMAFAGPG
jgi:hypothetical protein